METFEHLLYQLHLSYIQARKNKRNTHNQLGFEINQEEMLYNLACSIYNRTYQPKPSVGFIIEKPVVREIFAADFRDRVIHHLIYRCISNIVEKHLIHDTYSCRIGKGTQYGVRRVEKFMRSCSENWSKPTYFLKLDIQAYFMTMSHDIILDKIQKMLPPQKSSFLGISRETLNYLLETTVNNSVTNNCKIKGCKSDWLKLPESKSLFSYPTNIGLPIGNLTSQLIGNVYLNDFDHYVKTELKLKYYGRYVDDMVFIHSNRALLQEIIPVVSSTLLEKFQLKVHPKKIVLRSVEDGLPFLGQIIKPFRRYTGNRTKNNFHQTIQHTNVLMATTDHFSWKELENIQARINSYLGTMKHANTFNLRKVLLGRLSRRFFDFFQIDQNFYKVIINKDFWEWHFSLNYQFTN